MHRMGKTWRWWLLPGAVFVAAGLYLSIWGFTTDVRQGRTSSWTMVPGRITESDLRVSRQGRYGEFVVCYEYTVDGVTREGRDLWYRDNVESLSEVRSISERMRDGEAVAVFVDPAGAGRAVLMPGWPPSRGAFWEGVWGVAAVLFGAMVCGVMRRARR
jgi:hypothetical protein